MIAVIHGACISGEIGFAAFCYVVIASEDVLFLVVEVNGVLILCQYSRN